MFVPDRWCCTCCTSGAPYTLPSCPDSSQQGRLHRSGHSCLSLAEQIVDLVAKINCIYELNECLRSHILIKAGQLVYKLTGKWHCP